MTLLRFKALSVIGLSIVTLCLISCNSAFQSRFQKAGTGLISGAAATTGAFLRDPFSGPDVVAVSQSLAAAAVVNKRVKPVTAATGKRELTLAECRNLALTNSLELQQARIEEVTQKAIEYSNKTKMLPHGILSAELSNRDNYPYSYSEILGQEGVTPTPGGVGTGVNQFSTGRERPTWRYVMETRWSPTDAALAYYLTRSSRNDATKQHYIRVRIAQKLLGVVDSSYFRLLGLQKAIPMAEKLVGLRRTLAGKNEELFDSKLIPVEDYHKVNQKLIKSQRLLSSLRNEAEQQRNLLASATSLSPEYCVDGGFFVVGPLEAPTFREPVCNLEMLAIKSRPEAYRAGLDHLNSVNDLKRTIIKYFPKVTAFWRYTRDRDKHLYENDWKEVGGLVYFDILEWCSNVWESRATKMIVAKTEREVGAIALGITSQVRTSAIKYYDALDQLNAATKFVQSSRKVLKIERERTARDAAQKLALLEAEGDVLHEEVELTRAIGEAQGMLAELYSTVGTNYNEPLVR